MSNDPKFSTLVSPLQLVLPQLASPQLASPQLASPQLPEGMTSTKKCHHFRFLQSHPQISICFLRSQYRVKIQLSTQTFPFQQFSILESPFQLRIFPISPGRSPGLCCPRASSTGRAAVSPHQKHVEKRLRNGEKNITKDLERPTFI